MLQNLPTELTLKIISNLPVPTLLALRLVSHSLNAIIATHERLICTSVASHAFTSTTLEDFPVSSHSKHGVADLAWLKELERRERILRELDKWVHVFSGGECDCDHPAGEERHARGLRKLWALSDICAVHPPPMSTPAATSTNPRKQLLRSMSHQALTELWNTVEILMVELHTAYMGHYGHAAVPSGEGGAVDPWCLVFEGGPEWVWRWLEGASREDWAQRRGWSGIYGEVVGVYMEGEKRRRGVA